MAKSIPSGEMWGKPTAIQGERPQHVDPEHLKCAFYLTRTEGDLVYLEMQCPHGMSASGSFYNEDYIFQLRQLVHIVLDGIDRVGPFSDPAWLKCYLTVEQLRELTK